MYFKEITDFKGLYKTFQGSSKSGDIFRAQSSIYDGVFLWIYLTAYYFYNKSSIIDVRLFYIRKYWNFQSEVKVEQMIAIVTTRSVSCCFLKFINCRYSSYFASFLYASFHVFCENATDFSGLTRLSNGSTRISFFIFQDAFIIPA